MNTLDINSILYHVQHFYEIIIPKATYFSDWDEKEIALAFEWGKFCEEVYLKSSGSINAAKVDELLHSVSKEYTNIYKIPLCFEDLPHSNLLLSQAFFDNAHIDDSEVQAALQNNQSNENYFTTNMKNTIALSTLCSDLIESLKPIKMENSGTSLYCETKSELFLDFLKNFLEQQSTGNVEHNLYSAFTKLCMDEKNMTTFFHILVHNVDGDAIAVEVQQFAVNWMLLQLYGDNSCNLAKFVWNQTPLKMRELAAKHEAFSCYYINLITKCVNSVTEKDGNNKDSWKFRPLTTSDITLSFDQIVNHFEMLLNTEDDLGKIVRQHIKSFLNTKPVNIVWNEITLKLKNL